MLLALLLIAAFMGTSAWFLVRWSNRDMRDIAPWSDKVIVTTILCLVIFFAIPVMSYWGLILIVGSGAILSLLWTPSVAGAVFGQMFSAFDGGNDEVDKKPHYSTAQGLRRRNNSAGAIEEVKRQLEKFPGDFDGQMLQAEIHAEDLNDLASARYVIEELLQQEGHPSHRRAYALTTLADWQLSKARDPQAARIAFQRIVDAYPDSELSQRALQRIAHLPSEDMLAQRDNSPGIEMREFPRDLGIKGRKVAINSDPEAEAAKLTLHLEQHPKDNEVREQLAILYAEQMNRMDLAQAQLEQLANLSLVPQKQIVHWLNLLASLQLKVGHDQAAARQTLQRILDRFPGTAVAEKTRLQLATLDYAALPGEAKEPGIKPGSYEKDLGLKQRPY